MTKKEISIPAQTFSFNVENIFSFNQHQSVEKILQGIVSFYQMTFDWICNHSFIRHTQYQLPCSMSFKKSLNQGLFSLTAVLFYKPSITK